jgi:two-component system, LuxR family, sensor kinase FixL
MNVDNEKESIESLTDALFESTTEGIIITNRSGEIVKINPSAEKMFRYGHNELVGQKIEILVPRRVVGKHEGYRADFNAHPKARSMGMGMDLYAVRSDKTEFPVEISLSYFKRNEENYVISFIIDITQRKKADNEILNAKANLESYAGQLKASNQELEQFAYVASHDLQEPLRKIQAFGDRIKTRDGDKLSVEGQDYLERMLNAAGRMQHLINALLTFSRVSSQAKPFKMIDLNQVMKEVLSDLEVAIETAGANISVDPMPSIEADATQMWQLLQNLISNALKFHKADVNPELKISTESINCPPEGIRKCIRITISDNGIGFDEKYSDRIFNIFQRLESANYKGTGVGLAICKKIAQRHGGDIIAKSKPGLGSSFIITLPVHHSEFMKGKND